MKGPGIDPLFDFLTSDDDQSQFAGEIKWNFNKFLVNRKGEVIARFEPREKPNTESADQRDRKGAEREVISSPVRSGIPPVRRARLDHVRA